MCSRRRAVWCAIKHARVTHDKKSRNSLGFIPKKWMYCRLLQWVVWLCDECRASVCARTGPGAGRRHLIFSAWQKLVFFYWMDRINELLINRGRCDGGVGGERAGERKLVIAHPSPLSSFSPVWDEWVSSLLLSESILYLIVYQIIGSCSEVTIIPLAIQ